MIVGPSNLTRGLQCNASSNVLGNSIDTMMYPQLSLTNILLSSTSLWRAPPSQGNLTYVKWVHSMGKLLALAHSLMPLDGVQRSQHSVIEP